jgi:hypothetical protein
MWHVSKTAIAGHTIRLTTMSRLDSHWHTWYTVQQTITAFIKGYLTKLLIPQSKSFSECFAAYVIISTHSTRYCILIVQFESTKLGPTHSTHVIFRFTAACAARLDATESCGQDCLLGPADTHEALPKRTVLLSRDMASLSRNLGRSRMMVFVNRH